MDGLGLVHARFADMNLIVAHPRVAYCAANPRLGRAPLVWTGAGLRHGQRAGHVKDARLAPRQAELVGRTGRYRLRAKQYFRD